MPRAEIAYLALFAQTPLRVSFFLNGLAGFDYGHGHVVIFFLVAFFVSLRRRGFHCHRFLLRICSIDISYGLSSLNSVDGGGKPPPSPLKYLYGNDIAQPREKNNFTLKSCLHN